MGIFSRLFQLFDEIAVGEEHVLLRQTISVALFMLQSGLPVLYEMQLLLLAERL